MNWNSTENETTSEQVMLGLRQRVMKTCASIVVLELQKSLPSVVQNWINDNLTDTNICELALHYKKTLDGFVEENKVGVHPSLWEEFQSLCEKRSDERCKVHMEKVMDVGQKFNQNIRKAFDVFGCFPDEAELETLGANEMENVTTNLEAAFVLPATKLLSEKLMKIYKEKNKSILAAHMLKTKKIAESIKKVYRKEMEAYMKNHFMRENELQKLHSGLQADALQVFDKNFGDNAFGKYITIHESCKEELRQDLENEFRLYQVKNNEQLSGWATLQESHIQKLVAECTSDIKEFGNSTERKLTGGTLKEIGRITKKLKEGMNLRNEFMLKVETPSECMKIDWLALEIEFENMWMNDLFEEQLTFEMRIEKIYQGMLNIHQENLLQAVKTNPREDIIALHKTMLEECLTVFDNVVPYDDGQYTKEQLKNQLNGIFNITITSSDYYQQYEEKMVNLLRRNNYSIKADTFLGYHNEVKSMLKKLLEIEGKRRFGDKSQDYLSQYTSHLENRIEELFQKFKTFQNPTEMFSLIFRPLTK